MVREIKEKEYFTPEMLEYVEKAEKVAERYWLPYRVQFDYLGYFKARDQMPNEFNALFKAGKESGLLGWAVPKEYGGRGLSHLQRCLISAEKVKVGQSMLFDSVLPDGRCGVGYAEFAKNEEVKKKYMKRSLDGAIPVAFVTDPEAGVDAAMMRTTAVKDGDYYVLNGHKTWMEGVTKGRYGQNFHVAFAKTDPSAGYRGISGFIIEPDHPGLVYGREGDLLAHRFASRQEVAFKNLRVHKDYMVGDEHLGMWVLLNSVNIAISWYAYMAVGAAECAMDDLTDYVRHTVRFGKRLAEYQGIQFPIAEMVVGCETGRAIVHKACDLLDRDDKDKARVVNIAMRYCGPMAIEVTTKCLELLAQRGVERGEGHPTEQLWREVQICNLFRTPNLDKIYLARKQIGKEYLG